MTLEEIVTFCRKHNILVWKGDARETGGSVELHFGPPLEPGDDEEDDVKDVDKEALIEKRRGKDGRTAAEQFALYGRVYDAEE